MKSSSEACSAAMEPQSASLSPSLPSSSVSTKPDQSHYRRISQTEDRSPYPIQGLAADTLYMRVKGGSKICNLLGFVTARMQGESRDGRDGSGTLLRQVVFTGSGRAVTKTITCVEILKRKVGGLHQVSKLYYKTVTEVWANPQQGTAGTTTQRTVPAICILLSKDPLDPQDPGYQPPQKHTEAESSAEGLECMVPASLTKV